MKISIRNMVKSDIKRVLEIYEQGIQTGIATFETKCPTEAEWDEAHLEVLRFVSEVDGVTAGWICLSPTSKRACYSGVAEVSIYIANEYKGNGIGSILMDKVISEYETNGFWMLYSSIIADNKASLHLHEKAGFRTIGVREKICKDFFGKWQDTVIMEIRSSSEKYR